MAKASDEVLEFLRKQAAKGGKARKKNLTKEELSEQGRKAVLARWEKKRKAAGGKTEGK